MIRKRIFPFLLVIWGALVLAVDVASQQSSSPRIGPLPTPTPAASATPSPAATSTPSPTPFPTIQTLTELQAKIRERIQRPELRRGRVGIKIVSLFSGKVIFEEDADKYFMPASNMKNFTVAAALERLTPDFRFVTSVFATAPLDSSGVVKGNLRIFGRGDVSLSAAFLDEAEIKDFKDPTEKYYRGLDKLAGNIVAAGVKRVDGDIIADDSYFRGSSIPSSWEWDDLQWYYGAEVSSLPLNDNALDLSVLPGAAGYSCVVTLLPVTPVVRVINQCTTAAVGTPRTLRIEKKLGENLIEITGTLPIGNSGFRGSITVSRPAELFAALLKQRLEQRGVVVAGQPRRFAYRPAFAPAESIEIAKLESAPLSVIAAKTMKPSQNMYTEVLLRTLGEHMRTNGPHRSGDPLILERTDSADLGTAAVANFLNGIGIPEDSIIQHDGSGLSRHNLITPGAVIQLYTYMAKQSKYSHAWRESLTIGGIDGTLKSRFIGTRAESNVRGKTGTIDQVSALSGYVTTAAGEQLIFSIIVNGVNTTRDRTTAIDDIVVQLAEFNGRVDQLFAVR